MIARTPEVILDETLNALGLARVNLHELSYTMNVADPIQKHQGETTGKDFRGYELDVLELFYDVRNTFSLARAWAAEAES
jgi:hypothetical protein